MSSGSDMVGTGTRCKVTDISAWTWASSIVLDIFGKVCMARTDSDTYEVEVNGFSKSASCSYKYVCIEMHQLIQDVQRMSRCKWSKT
jgi:hypothetical protein